MDIFESEFRGRKEKFLATVDHFSDFIEIDLLDNMRMETIINICQKNFSRHGHPEVVCSDGALSFCNKEFQIFAREWEFKHVTSAPYHQQGNGKAESAVKVAKQLINKAEEEKKDFYRNLANQRNTPNKTGYSPCQRLMSRRTRCTVPISKDKLKPELCKDVAETLKIQRETAKRYYDRSTKSLPDLINGETVMIRLKPGVKELWTPGVVHSKYDNRSWIITVNEAQYRRNREHIKEYSKRLIEETERTEENVINTEEMNENSTRQENDVMEDSNEDQEDSMYEDAETGSTSSNQSGSTSTVNNHSLEEPISSRPVRSKRPPVRLNDYVLDRP